MTSSLAVAGMGSLCAAGLGVDALVQATLARKPLGAPVTRYDVQGLRTTRANLVPEQTLRLLQEKWPNRDVSVLYALAAIDEALSQAPLQSKRVGLYVGTSVGCVLAWADWHQHEVRQQPHAYPEGTTHADTARLLERELGALARVVTVSTACTSASTALMQAADAIHLNMIDEAIVVGVDVLCPFVHVGFERLGALAADATEPAPFALARNGMWLGEGAAAIVLSRDPNAPVRYLGGGTASDGVHMTAPARDGCGLVAASQAALADAGLSAADVDWISVHGTSTPFNDAMETAGLTALFGDRIPPVHALKPIIGHTLGASGLFEAVLSARAVASCTRYPSFTHGERDPACARITLDDTPVSADIRTVLSLNSAMAGHNSAIIVGRVS